MKLAIIGHGYVGLVTAAVFADLGNDVWVVGRTKEKIAKLKTGDPLFFEPGLEEVLKRNLKAERLHFTLSYHEALPGAQVVFIAVGTPPKANGEADLSSVLAVAEKLGPEIKKYTVVACKSTVPVGTNLQIKKLLSQKVGLAKDKFDIASCPEFLREGTALGDTFSPDRVVIGTENKKAEAVLLELHKPISGVRVLTNIATAEMIKYASNTLLATKVSYANMLAFLADKVGADIEQILYGVGLDKRLGRKYLHPGIGFGGSCLPKDVKALISTGRKYGEDMKLLEAVMAINSQAVDNLVTKVQYILGGKLADKTIGILGLSFKPDTDDLREAPSLKLIEKLKILEPSLKIKVYDPVAMTNAKKILKDVIYSKSAYETAENSSLIIIVTEWNEFRQLDLRKLAAGMKAKNLIDGRNIYDPKLAKKSGFNYLSIGR